jgi:hypothetical protein
MAAVIILKYTGLLCLIIVCASIVYATLVLCTSREVRGRIIFTLPLPMEIKDYFRPHADRISSRYYLEVRPDHEAVVSRILDCMKVRSRWSLPADVLSLLYPEDVTPPAGLELESGARLPIREEHAILQLSKTIMIHRMQLMDRVARSYRLWQITSLTSILLGMLTTIVVATSTTDFGKEIITIRILAIVFPALSTAAAAAFAFYGPQATWTQATLTLSSLSQLHGQMGLEVWDIECTDVGASNVKLAAKLNDWSKRFLDIQTISAAAGQGSAQQGRGTGTSGAEGGASGSGGSAVGAEGGSVGRAG